MLASCSGGGGGGSPAPAPTTAPTPTPTPNPGSTASVDAAAFVCPTSDRVSSDIRSSAAGERTHRAVLVHHTVASAPVALEVTYASSATTRASLASRIGSAGARVSHETSYPNGRTIQTVYVGSANPTALAATLRTQSGVVSVTQQSERRHLMKVTTPYYPNDPYFNGFKTTVPVSATATAMPATYHVTPYSESAQVPGQWNFHDIGLEYAFGYGQAGNGSGVTNAGALGSSATKIAVIDTGADTTIPELSSKIVYQRCFITNATGVQSTGSFVTDRDGHGTDVTGIAASNTNNALGFAGAGGAASIYSYKVYPDPDDMCATDGSNDPQCGADVDDVDAAIDDAVAQHVNVISLSLGGGGCSNGVDTDSGEEAAITNALNNNIVVVASAGNDGVATTGSVAAPACISGVIAAGATSLADGQTNGTGAAQGSQSAPFEYVASYSQYGTPGSAFRNTSAWGIVAPGGDPGSQETGSNADLVDDLHWIEDVWTSTPLDTNFAGNCGPDYPGNVQTDQQNSCRTLIAGTSMSAPTIAGAAALVISANAAYQSPSKMKSLFCSTTDDLSDPKEGCGRLNLYRAMAVAVGDPTPP